LDITWIHLDQAQLFFSPDEQGTGGSLLQELLCGRRSMNGNYRAAKF
jgi:hypothetical protein